MKRIVACFLCALLLLPLIGLGEAPLTAKAVFSMLESSRCAQVYQLFDAPMREAFTEEELQSVLPSLNSAYGRLLSLGEEEITLSPPYTITALPLRYERENLLFQVTWEKDAIAGLYFSILPGSAFPDEAPPSGVQEEAVRVGQPALPGTLTLPTPVPAPLPAVVLLHGSGPNDRDETVGQTKLFRDLARGLAQRGIAVLRYDKRTYVYGKEYTSEALIALTVQEEAIDDALQAAALLKADPRIDPKRVYLVGHSLGACISPRIARENPDAFAGLILLSGSPLTLADIVLHQSLASARRAAPETQAQLTRQIGEMAQEWEAIRTGTADEAKQKTFAGQPAYYFWDLARHDIEADLSALSLPTLIINGGRDFQVPDDDGIAAWRSLTLPDTVQILYKPALNHLLMAPDAPDEARGTAQEYSTPCHAAQDVIDDIAQFILQ